MAISRHSRTLLASTGAAALAGTSLAALLAYNIATLADAGASARDISLADPDVALCKTAGASGRPGMMLRLAQTEVPRAEMSAASSAPAFADTQPPLWDGLGSITYKITTKNEKAQAYFNQGLRLAYAFNHGEAHVLSARRNGSTRLRDVFLGRSVGAWPQYQSCRWSRMPSRPHFGAADRRRLASVQAQRLGSRP